VSPGNPYFEGGIWQSIEQNMPDLFNAAMSFDPTGHMASPDKIMRGVKFPASRTSGFTMGTDLVIDGALTKGVRLWARLNTVSGKGRACHRAPLLPR
jgi:3-oxoacyl-[acyl-carrier protein] reductase